MDSQAGTFRCTNAVPLFVHCMLKCPHSQLLASQHRLQGVARLVVAMATTRKAAIRSVGSNWEKHRQWQQRRHERDVGERSYLRPEMTSKNGPTKKLTILSRKTTRKLTWIRWQTCQATAKKPREHWWRQRRDHMGGCPSRALESNKISFLPYLFVVTVLPPSTTIVPRAINIPPSCTTASSSRFCLLMKY